MKMRIYARDLDAWTNGRILAQHNIDGDAQPAQDDKYFYQHDRLGSVRLVIDDEGAVHNDYTYEPFGEMLATECPARLRFAQPQPNPKH